MVDRDMLTRVWNEMDYRIDVCCITKRYDLSIYKIMYKNLKSFSLYRCKNYHDSLRSLFVTNF
jgi:hypothetical protein